MEGLSHRTFAEIACGTLASMPTLAGGLALAPRPAYAADATDDLELRGLESEYVVIDVVNDYEVGFIVVDVSKGTVNEAGMVSYPLVEGAKVTVTSRFNGKTATGGKLSSRAQAPTRRLIMHMVRTRRPFHPELIRHGFARTRAACSVATAHPPRFPENFMLYGTESACDA